MEVVLIVGATGNVGSAAVRELARQSVPTRALVRPQSEAGAMTGLGVEVASGDLRDPASVEAALRGVSSVIFAATAMSRHMSGDHRLRIRDVDRAGAMSLIDASEAANVERFVYVSASRRYLAAPCDLMDAALDSEARLRRSGMHATVVMAEPYAELWFSGTVGFEPMEGRARIFGRGMNRIRFTSTDDVGAAVAALAVADHAPAVVELGGPEALSILEAVDIAESLTGRRVKRQRIPRAALRVGSTLLRGMRPELASAMAFGLALDTSSSDVGPGGFAPFGIQPRSATESLRRMVAAAPRTAARSLEPRGGGDA